MSNLTAQQMYEKTSGSRRESIGTYFSKDSDGTTHHPSNWKNCSKCMDLWVKRENNK